MRNLAKVSLGKTLRRRVKSSTAIVLRRRCLDFLEMTAAERRVREFAQSCAGQTRNWVKTRSGQRKQPSGFHKPLLYRDLALGAAFWAGMSFALSYREATSVDLLTAGVELIGKGPALRAVDRTIPHKRSLKSKASLESFVHVGRQFSLQSTKRHSLLRENL